MNKIILKHPCHYFSLLRYHVKSCFLKSTFPLAVLSLVFLSLIFSMPAVANDLILKNNLERASQGDYIVTSQSKSFTMLLIRGKVGDQLYIEEITIPASNVPKALFSWRQWLENGAMGHTCWLLYTIYLPTGTMQQTYSYTRGDWISIPQNFFSTLLNLKLTKINDNDRKKTGPRLSSDTSDRRRLWQPDVVVDGKVIKGVSFDAWKTKWPSDGSEMSGKLIEIYIPTDSDKYPSYFPYSLQISGIVGNAKVRIVDSGSSLMSPKNVP